MKIDKRKLDLCRARKCMSSQQLLKLSRVSTSTLYGTKGKEVSALTVGKIAAALGVDPEEIVVDEERG